MLEHSGDDLSKWNIDLPPENDLIPQDLSIVAGADNEGTDVPTLIKTDGYELWFQQDRKWRKPIAVVKCALYMPQYILPENDKTQAAFCRIWEKVLLEHLREYLYMASLTQMSFDLEIHSNFLEFSWGGYSDKISTFLAQTLLQIRNLGEQDLQFIFDQCKKRLLTEFQNSFLEPTRPQTLRKCK